MVLLFALIQKNYKNRAKLKFSNSLILDNYKNIFERLLKTLLYAPLPPVPPWVTGGIFIKTIILREIFLILFGYLKQNSYFCTVLPTPAIWNDVRLGGHYITKSVIDALSYWMFGTWEILTYSSIDNVGGGCYGYAVTISVSVQRIEISSSTL